MKALTLHQPWASLIALGVKTIETRSWSTEYRGPLVIHAGARQVHSGNFLMLARIARTARTITRDQEQEFRALAVPFGAIVATCELVDVVPIVRDPENVSGPLAISTVHGAVHVLDSDGIQRDFPGQAPYGDFTPGRYAWLLDKIEPVDPPVPCRGWPGLWEWRS